MLTIFVTWKDIVRSWLGGVGLGVPDLFAERCPQPAFVCSVVSVSRRAQILRYF